MMYDYIMDTHPGPNSKRITISLPSEALDKLDRLAAENDRTRSNTILRWIKGAKATQP